MFGIWGLEVWVLDLGSMSVVGLRLALGLKAHVPRILSCGLCPGERLDLVKLNYDLIKKVN